MLDVSYDDVESTAAHLRRTGSTRDSPPMTVSALLFAASLLQAASLEKLPEISFKGKTTNARCRSFGLTTLYRIYEGDIQNSYNVTSLVTDDWRSELVAFVNANAKSTKWREMNVRFALYTDKNEALILDELGYFEFRFKEQRVRGLLPIQELRTLFARMFPFPDQQGHGLVDWPQDMPSPMSIPAHTQTPQVEAYYMTFGYETLFPLNATSIKKDGFDVTSLVTTRGAWILQFFKQPTATGKLNKQDIKLWLREGSDTLIVDSAGNYSLNGAEHSLGRERFNEFKRKFFFCLPINEVGAIIDSHKK